MLWLLGQNTPHGPVRLLFTVAEEVGLQGAGKVDPAWLTGRYLINTDGFTLGKAVISSAGGLRETFTRPLETAPRQKSALFSLSLTGFPGGHSGYDIHRGRPNPIRLCANFLRKLDGLLNYELLSLSGGHAHNAIPMDCAALLAVDGGDVPALNRAAADFFRDIAVGRAELSQVDRTADRAWTADCRDRVLAALAGLRIGVFAWRDQEKAQVSASANLGRVEQTKDTVSVACFIRAARREDEEALDRPASPNHGERRVFLSKRRLPRLARAGGKPAGRYPGRRLEGSDRPGHNRRRSPCGAGTLCFGGKKPGADHGQHRAGHSGPPQSGRARASGRSA